VISSYINKADEGDMLGELPSALYLTPDVDDWDPDDHSWANQEAVMTDWKGENVTRKWKASELG